MKLISDQNIIKRKMAAKVYTKKGDKGFTSIMGTSERLLKSHRRIEAIGTVDELNSYVGVLRSLQASRPLPDKVLETLVRIQNNLFNIGASLAVVSHEKSDINLNVIELENEMDDMSKHLKPLKNFILPAGSQSICFCHVARTVTRRAERKITKLAISEIVDPAIPGYMNRLSDYFFVLARYLAVILDEEEVIWLPNK